jgi:hypothetical protein
LQKAKTSSCVVEAPDRLTTKALTLSPLYSSTTPIATASATSGCSRGAFSSCPTRPIPGRGCSASTKGSSCPPTSKYAAMSSGSGGCDARVPPPRSNTAPPKCIKLSATSSRPRSRRYSERASSDKYTGASLTHYSQRSAYLGVSLSYTSASLSLG